MEEINKLKQILETILINSKTITVEIDETNNDKVTTEMYLFHNEQINIIFYTLKLVFALTEKIKELEINKPDVLRQEHTLILTKSESEILGIEDIPPPPTPEESIPPPPPTIQPITPNDDIKKNLTPLVLPPSLITQPVKNSLTL